MVQLVRHAAFGSQTAASRRTLVNRLPIRAQPCFQLSPSRARLLRFATAPNQPAPQDAAVPEEEFVGIPTEEDTEVPGTYFDALNPQTKLGKAVRAAVDELNHLNAMERETLQQCDDLLKKLGIKTSILQGAPAPAQEEPEEEEEQQQQEQ